MKGPKTMRALRAVLTAAIAHACAAFAPAAGSLGLRAFAPDRAHSRGLIGRISDASAPSRPAVFTRSRVQCALAPRGMAAGLPEASWAQFMAELQSLEGARARGDPSPPSINQSTFYCSYRNKI